MVVPATGRLSRRSLLASAFATAGGLAAACAPPPAPPTPATAKPAPAAPTTAEAKAAPTAAAKPAGASAGVAGDRPRGGTLSIGVTGDPTWLGDPHQSTSSLDRHFFFAIFNSLLELDEKSNIRPGLAKSWERPDPVTFVFQLEEGVTFHDGTPFDAEVAKWNFERMLSPEPKLIRRSELSAIDKLEVAGKHTLKVLLKRTDAAFLATLTDRAGMMVSPDATKKHNLQDLLRNPVGTGPFKFVEWLEDDHVKLARNPDYFRKGLPYLDELVFKPISDATVRLANLRAGTLQLISDVSPRDVQAVKDDAKLEVSISTAMGFDRIELNGAKPPFDNVALRKVIATAIDRRALHRVVYLGQGTIAQGPISPSSWAYEPIEGWTDQANVEQARKFLKEGGHPDGFEFEIDVASDSETDMQRAELLEQQLKQVGVTMKVFQYKGAVGAQRRSSGTYVSRVGGWSGRPDPHTTLFPHYTTGGANNWGKYSNKEVDDLLTRASTELDQNKRKELYTGAVKILSATVAEVFHEFETLRTAHSRKLVGFVEIPDGRFRLENVALAT